MLNETQAADLGYIVKYAESTRDSLKKRGEQPQSMLLMNLDRIIQMADGLLDQLKEEIKFEDNPEAEAAFQRLDAAARKRKEINALDKS